MLHRQGSVYLDHIRWATVILRVLLRCISVLRESFSKIGALFLWIQRRCAGLVGYSFRASRAEEEDSRQALFQWLVVPVVFEVWEIGNAVRLFRYVLFLRDED